MPPSKRLGFSLNPLWPHYAAAAAIAVGIVAGLGRYFILDYSDPLHCNALMNKGSWLDSAHKNWQPEGCMLHSYQPKDATACLASKQVVFIGDSVTRVLFFQFANIVDNKLPTAPPDDGQKHVDHTLHSDSGVQLDFVWDPFLNTSRTDLLLGIETPREGAPRRDPALLVIGTGLWHLAYANTSGGLPAWEATIEAKLGAITHSHSRPSESIVMLPVEEVINSKLRPERKDTIHASDIDAMNSDLYHRIHPPSLDPLGFFSSAPESLPVSLPLVFNQMLDPSQTEDGLHFSDAVVRPQANILLNLRCNDVLPKRFPMDKTCCRSYPWPSLLQSVILMLAISWGPYTYLASHYNGQGYGSYFPSENQIPPLIFSAAIALIFAADRTGFWLKEQKQFNPWTFAFLAISSLAVGLGTVTRADKDSGFLNREQTDEWKGWMQASKISGIYNPVRVLVAAYLFMTGYGHTTFYIRKADFGFLRIAQVMVRLNVFTLLLAYSMNTDYISYYFSPLVSFWYLVVYGTMAVGSQFNERTPFLVAKILVSMGVVTWVMREQWLLDTVFEFLDRICGIKWSAREWSFRVNLDIWIVYFGMFAALAVLKLREHRLTDHAYWPLAVKTAIGASGIVMLWFFAFELLQESKFTYNTWHPYISFLPITAFVILRNANAILRSASSRAFAFIGTCSLETFIIQYHFWLAGDTKGVLLVIPGTRWRPINFIFTTVMFIYVSHRVAQATGEITSWICGSSPKTLPTTNNAPASFSRPNNATPRAAAGEEESVPLHPNGSTTPKDEDELPREPDTPIRPLRRWVDRLADSASTESRPSPGFRVWYGEAEWKPGLKTKLGVGVGLMWIVNVLWSYP
ncbi:hypothetical protein PLICRDRAFT_99944 [Plicaturopsis crispa FD-325 SS-3]|nr:hypothetical protein PLICRDRAFT_99944 [Plicaturopsis crispa FD-325 SS-3]